MREKSLSMLLLVACLSAASSARGGLVVNEVLANEPGGYQYLEWFELYADTSGAVSLAAFEVVVEDDTVRFADGIGMAGGGYLVVCRKLVSTTGAASFEGRWGDSSGVWGDSEAERAMGTPREASFGLRNSAGAVRLYCDGQSVSELVWDESGSDGVSWERITADRDDCGQSEDASGGTPGRVNSLTPVGYDLALLEAAPFTLEGRTEITVRVGNRGAVASAKTTLELQDSAGTVIDWLPVPSLDPGESCMLAETYSFDAMYVALAAQLPDDDRAANNRIEFLAGGREFPPFVLSEFLANPSSGGSEWAEIRNVDVQARDLSGWRLGDGRVVYGIVDGALPLAAGERLVLVQDEASFATAYPDFSGTVAEPGSWAALNNDGDTLRLVDPSGLLADRFGYDDVPPEGHTWARSEGTGSPGVWGRSQYPGGTPGDVNRVVWVCNAATLSVEVAPRVFSPDGDGYEDETRVAVTAPNLDDFEIGIYDREGRKVRRLGDEVFDGEGFAWDGRDGSGRLLPVGIYVVYVEVAGIGSAKATVVVAR